MFINDKRNTKVGVLWADLVQGQVYIDPDGVYVMSTNSGSVISLGNGQLWDYSYYNREDKFTSVKATLEVE